MSDIYGGCTIAAWGVGYLLLMAVMLTGIVALWWFFPVVYAS